MATRLGGAMSTLDLVRAVPAFADRLGAEQLSDVADRLRTAEFARGTVLMRQGERSTRMFAIARGSVERSMVAAGGKAVVAKLGVGEIIGLFPMMTDGYCETTVTVRKRVTALVADQSMLREILAMQPVLVASFTSMMEQRQAERLAIRDTATRSNAIGLDRLALENLMRSFYSFTS